MSSWATLTSSFSSPPSFNYSLSSSPTPTHTYTYDAYHQLGSFEPLAQCRYPRAGGHGLPVQGNNDEYDYKHLQKLVQLRESKLADCSYLTRQRKKVSVSERAPAQLKPGPPIKPASELVARSGDVSPQREYNVARYPTGLEDSSGFPVQGEASGLGDASHDQGGRPDRNGFQRPTKFSTPEALQGFKSSWDTHFVPGTLGGSRFGRNDCFSGFWATQVSGYSSDESTTDSESDALSFRAGFTWSFPISREERMGGVNRSAYSFDEKGKLRGLKNSPVAIILTPPSAPTPKWRPSPNDPACRPRSESLLHPMWRAKH